MKDTRLQSGPELLDEGLTARQDVHHNNCNVLRRLGARLADHRQPQNTALAGLGAKDGIIEPAYDVGVRDPMIFAEVKSIETRAKDFCIGQNRSPGPFGREVKFGKAIFDYNTHKTNNTDRQWTVFHPADGSGIVNKTGKFDEVGIVPEKTGTESARRHTKWRATTLVLVKSQHFAPLRNSRSFTKPRTFFL